MRPTSCDEELKAKVITHGDCQNAVSWYERSWVQINEALPIAIDGVIYQPRWQDIMDRQTLPLWRSDKLSHPQAVAYIYWSLKRLARGLNEERAGPG